ALFHLWWCQASGHEGLLKKLESKGLVSRKRSEEDERNLIVTITEQGMQMREKACKIPEAMGGCINLGQEEASTLYHLLYKILGKEKQEESDGMIR
ncbi:MAG: winged helix DNA-binding protein, partial [Clostridiales bacterium]|nr:winged helix DNA-binding protein [Clostridiales bacterium]